MKIRIDAGIPVDHLNQTLRNGNYEIVIGKGGFLLQRRQPVGLMRELERRQQAARQTA